MPAVFCLEPAGFAVEWRGEQLQRHPVPWVDFWAIIQAIQSGPERPPCQRTEGRLMTLMTSDENPA
jgi:hypothetical protein